MNIRTQYGSIRVKEKKGPYPGLLIEFEDGRELYVEFDSTDPLEKNKRSIMVTGFLPLKIDPSMKGIF